MFSYINVYLNCSIQFLYYQFYRNKNSTLILILTMSFNTVEEILLYKLQNGMIGEDALYVSLTKKHIDNNSLFGLNIDEKLIPSNAKIQLSLKKYGKIWKNDKGYQGLTVMVEHVDSNDESCEVFETEIEYLAALRILKRMIKANTLYDGNQKIQIHYF